MVSVNFGPHKSIILKVFKSAVLFGYFVEELTLQMFFLHLSCLFALSVGV